MICVDNELRHKINESYNYLLKGRKKGTCYMPLPAPWYRVQYFDIGSHDVVCWFDAMKQEDLAHSAHTEGKEL